jgi:hypothetical protein
MGVPNEADEDCRLMMVSRVSVDCYLRLLKHQLCFSPTILI